MASFLDFTHNIPLDFYRWSSLVLASLGGLNQLSSLYSTYVSSTQIDRFLSTLPNSIFKNLGIDNNASGIFNDHIALYTDTGDLKEMKIYNS